MKTKWDDERRGGALAGTPRPDWPEIAAGIALSALFHGGIILMALVSLWLATGETEEEEEGYEVIFDDVQLLALGEERDPNALPRLTGDEGAPAEPDVVDPDLEPTEADVEPEIDPDPTEESDPEEAERQRREEEARLEEERRVEEERRRREARQRRMQEAAGRFDAEGRGDEAPEGSPHGVPEGTVTDADMADMEQTYYARLLREIARHWEIPTTIADHEVSGLAGRVQVYVELSPQGHVERYEFRQKSGNEQFDESIERVIRQFQASGGGEQLPLPETEEIRQAVLQQGLRLQRWEHMAR